jgi:hypothetical protein
MTAAPGEVVMSEATYQAAGMAGNVLERRDLQLKGKSELVRVRLVLYIIKAMRGDQPPILVSPRVTSVSTRWRPRRYSTVMISPGW